MVVNTVGEPFRQYAQNMAQIRFRIETIQTAGAEQSVQQCTMLAAVIATEEHVDDMTFNILTIALVGYSRGGHHALGKYCGLRRAGCA